MTIILTPAAPVGSDVPGFAPSGNARSLSDRSQSDRSQSDRSQSDSGVTFGPTLSDARQRLASPDSRRTEPSNRQPDRGERSDRPDRPDDADRARRADEGAQADRSDRATHPSDRPRQADDADSPALPSGDEPAEDEAAAEESMAAAHSPMQTEPASAPNAPLAANLAMAATLHPTAKGAAGDGDPSTDPTVEAVAAPDPIVGVTPVDANVIADGTTSVDFEAMTAAVTDNADADVAEMGRQAALTSLDQVRDANLGSADRVRPPTAEELEGPSILADDATGADPFGKAQANEASLATPVQGRIDETNSERAGASEPAAEMAAAETADAAMVEAPPIEGDVIDQPVQQTAIRTVARTDTPDSVVVLAREATAAADSVRAAPAAAATTPAPVPAAEVNLWDDVRSAFDRIRSTGDGQEVRIRLRPAELGELLVQVRTRGDHVSVRLVASSAAAHQTLIDDRLRLASELARAGFNEGSVDIGQHDAGDSSRHGGERGDADRSGRPLDNAVGLDGVGPTRDIFERREPIRIDSGFRPGRSAYSTINLTL